MIQSLPIAIVAVLGVTLVCPAPLGAQERQAVVRVSPFTAVGVGSSEAAMLERLVVSYIVETRSFRVVDAQGQDRALVETEAALSRGETTAVALHGETDRAILRLQAFLRQPEQRPHDVDERDVVARLA